MSNGIDTFAESTFLCFYNKCTSATIGTDIRFYLLSQLFCTTFLLLG